ncbi:MAG: exo-alpha-sialidase [Akkermansia sp.]|nr:exo-alpha-sialidase [Akkermansia sp.]
MMRKYMCALLACGLAFGAEDFEKFELGAVTSGSTEYGKLSADKAEIVDKAHSGVRSLRLMGGTSSATITLKSVPNKASKFSFWVERWTGRDPFNVSVVAITGSGEEIVATLDKAPTGGGFPTKVEGTMPAGTTALKITSETPENTGIFVDDLLVVSGPMKVKGVEVVNPGPYPIMKRALHNPVLALDVQTEGVDNPKKVDKVSFTVNNPRHVANITLRSGDIKGMEFKDSIEYGSAKPDAEGKVTIRCTEPLQGGENYLWLDVEPAAKAVVGSLVTVKGVKVTVDGKDYTPEMEPVSQRVGVMLAMPGEAVGNQPDKADPRACTAFRIPGLIRTEKGTLIGCFDARYGHEGDLCADIDVATVRSTDGGQTWTLPEVSMDAGPGGTNGCGDPCILQDKKGRIWIQALVCHFGGGASLNVSKTGFDKNETGQWGLVYSDNDGKTWCKEYMNVTEQVKKDEWTCILAGPGNGICTKKGYIVFPAQIWQNGSNPRCRSTICYSKDNGKTWKMGTGLPCASSECQIVELLDGSIMINCRNEAGGGKRVIYVTKDMGETWEPHETNRSGLNEPSPQPCQGGFVAVQTRKYGRLLLFSNPQVYPRALMIVRASQDDGKTWNEGIMYDKRRCMGYSCMAMTDPDNVGIIYETCHTNGKNGARGIGFIRIPIESIMTGKDVDAKVGKKSGKETAEDATSDDAGKKAKKGKKKKKKKK